MAVEAFYGAQTAWMSDIDKSSSLVIDKRWNLPNLGDLRKVNWSAVEPIDILTAGYPCQPFSNAGQRKGLNDPRHMWPDIKQIISKLRPSIIVLENVRGHLSLGFKEVLQDLTKIGYDAKWTIVRASDVGAPHRRERLFILAQPAHTNSIGSPLVGKQSRTQGNQGQSQFEPEHLGKSIVAHSNGVRCSTRIESGLKAEISTIESIRSISNPNTEQLPTNGQTQRLGWRFETPSQLSMRRTPNPLDQSKLNPIFVEYMMGLPEGWVTDLGLSRAQQFKLLGNGVVPQQAYEAIRRLNAL
jgi:DNA (cytosine-5)-methyltransferase 1